ncbi:hypothetical protein M1247_04380 [Mycobacterium sp. 21AC1]|uniref:hypothetical protein n=1 Tax=[Mycobacterium] appelbergii TaxID=2939269 RepID=UPI0029394907|nr:hypothetical protein [Mycobacterium sp. 21AC1]MDV3124139.1 hypothetical protein [Mycobacterium sp. 21AC1]
MTKRLSVRPNVRRLIIAGGFAIAAMAPVVTAVGAAPHSAPAQLAACPGGEENDTFTDNCAPYLVPNSPAPASASVCPPGVTGAECGGSTEIQQNPAQNQMPGPITPQQPEEELQDVSTPDY